MLPFPWFISMYCKYKCSLLTTVAQVIPYYLNHHTATAAEQKRRSSLIIHMIPLQPGSAPQVLYGFLQDNEQWWVPCPREFQAHSIFLRAQGTQGSWEISKYLLHYWCGYDLFEWALVSDWQCSFGWVWWWMIRLIHGAFTLMGWD